MEVRGKLKYFKFTNLKDRKRIITNNPSRISKLTEEKLIFERKGKPDREELVWRKQDIGTLTEKALESLRNKSDVELDIIDENYKEFNKIAKAQKKKRDAEEKARVEAAKQKNKGDETK